MAVITFATLNINGLMTQTKVTMLNNFLRTHDTDIPFVQEVTSTEVLNIFGYTTHLNVGTLMRATAIIVKDDINLENVRVLPNGRAMAAVYRDILLINIYAPSGMTMRTEMEYFYNTKLSPLFRTDCENIICGGDFNCVIQLADVTGQYIYIQALIELVKGFKMRDTWNQDPTRSTYTFYHPNGASRLDRIYLTPGLWQSKTGINVLPAAFTDHCAVALILNMATSHNSPGTRIWKLNPNTVKDPIMKQKIKHEWEKWEKLNRYYSDAFNGGKNVSRRR
jgi:exonuclease III